MTTDKERCRDCMKTTIQELRKRNPFKDCGGFGYYGWNECCDELEKMEEE